MKETENHQDTIKRVWTSANINEAYIIKGLLKNANIESFTTNENYTSLYPNMNNAMGSGVDIMINGRDWEVAKEVLSNYNSEEFCCPKCQSSNIEIVKNSSFWAKIGVVFLALLIFAPLSNMNSKYRCRDCNKTFVL